MAQLKDIVAKNKEEKQKLYSEAVQFKEMLESNVKLADTECCRSNIIIAEY